MHAVFVAVLLSWTAITTALRIPPTWAAAVQKAVVHVDDRGEEPQQASAENRLSRQSKRDVWGSIDTATTAKNANREKAHSFVRDAVRAVGPSVVRIDCEREIPSLQAMLAPGNRPGREMTETVKVSGSGFIVSRDGYILTNAHVVENAKSTVISLANGRSYKAEVVGSDILTDLAVCRISANNDLKVAMLGDSSALSSGDWCIAVGCPVGLDFSCSLGIVSSPLRSASEVGTNLLKGNYIQTTAALNSGNSGGPLVNDLGEVVGINTMVRVNSEAIGFAIPINRAMEIYDILKLGKVVPHAYFGMEIHSLTPDFSSINNEDPNAVRLPEIHGVFVVRTCQ